MALKLHNNFLTTPSLTGHTAVATTPDYTITRATLATDTDADGYIREYQAGEARFTGATFRENLAKDTEDLSAWFNNTNVTVADDIDSYSGISLSRITDDATSGQHIARYANVFTAVGKVILSCYVKAGTERYVGMGWRTVDVSVFDTTTGAWTEVDSSYDGSGVTDLGNGYYRIWLYGSSTAANDEQIVGISSGPTQAEAFYVGSGDTILAGGFMVERQITGVTTPSDYLANDSATAVTSLTGTSTKGLLVEEARTNICLQSEDFSTTWIDGGTNLSVSTNQTTAPDGSTTADKIVDDGLGASGALAVRQDLTVTSGSNTFSVFAKKDQLDWVALGTAAYDAGGNGTSWFDLTNGVVGTKDANHSSSGIEAYADGWYRVWVVFSTTTDLAGRNRIYVSDGDNDITVDLSGGTSSIFLWGAQLEAGACPRSYIPTTTTSVTRNKDDALSADASWYNTNEGSIYCAASQPYDTGAISMILNINDNTLNGNVINLQRAANDKSVIEVRSGGSPQALFQSGASWTQNTTVQLAAAYKVDDFEMYMDGTRSGTGDQSGSVPVSISDINIGSSGIESQHFNGHIAEIAYWDERLDNTALKDYSDGTRSPGWMDGVMTEDEWWSWRRRLYVNRQQPG